MSMYTTKLYPLTDIDAAGEELKALTARHAPTDLAHMGWEILCGDARWMANEAPDTDDISAISSRYTHTSTLVDDVVRNVKRQLAQAKAHQPDELVDWQLTNMLKRAESVRFYASTEPQTIELPEALKEKGVFVILDDHEDLPSDAAIREAGQALIRAVGSVFELRGTHFNITVRPVETAQERRVCCLRDGAVAVTVKKN